MEFLEKTYFLLPNWKWIILVGFFIGVWSLRPIVKAFLAQLKKRPLRWEEGKDNFFSHILRQDIENPLSGILVALLWGMAIDALGIPDGLKKYLMLLIQLWLTYHVIHFCYLVVDALGVMIGKWAKNADNGIDNQLVPFATRSLKVIVVILGILVFLKNQGVEVVPLLAGLSVGGLAVALAAQDTFANLFGSITILFDQPFRVGDQIKVNDVDGVVEDIGFRSTRIRTSYNSLVSIPNSIVAKEKVDNLGVRPARRVKFNLGLHYDTTPEKIEDFCDHLEYLLKNDPEIDAKSVLIYFTTYSASSLDVLVHYHIPTMDYEFELKVTERINLEIWKIAKNMGVEFAYPTSTVYYKNPTIEANQPKV